MLEPAAFDLFSGCGGLTHGLKLAGFRVVGAIDNGKLAVETFKANHPGVRVWDRNIRRVAARTVMRLLGLRHGQLDLLAGCPPCQGFSVLRTRNGASQNRDRRNRLVCEVLRFARVLRPKTIMIENVPGLEGLNSAAIQARSKQLAAQARPGSPEDFAALIATEAPKWAAMARLIHTKGG
jgi:DNA (cytosine-5)-methyltransferase 1